MQNPFELLLTYADYRNGFVAEIWLNNTHLVEVYFDEDNQKRIEIFHIKPEFLPLHFDSFLMTLQTADEKLRMGQINPKE